MNRVLPNICDLLTFVKLLDASIVSHINFHLQLCFRMSSLACFFMVLASTYRYIILCGLCGCCSLYHFPTLLH